MEIITNAENRKELVKTLSGHFGQKSKYLGPPSFAYRIGSITVDRDAKVILEDDAGQLHTVWDGHGALAMIYGVDEWRKVKD